MFFMRQILVKIAPGATRVPSGTLTSVTNCAQLQGVAADAIFTGCEISIPPSRITKSNLRQNISASVSRHAYPPAYRTAAMPNGKKAFVFS
jgi:hypothetical protein